MNTEFILQAVKAVQQSILSSESVLEPLDRHIGDGDHYINMKRGSSSISAMHDELATLPADAVLQRIGMKLLSSIGGSAGPLIASFFMAMAKTIKEQGGESLQQIAAAFSAGTEATKARGKSGPGEKTMLDVLIPVSQAFTELTAQHVERHVLLDRLKQVALHGVHSTSNMLATKGRAASLGDRAIGHIDPGAKSCQIIIQTVCDLALTQA